jgi:hypothetical protein
MAKKKEVDEVQTEGMEDRTRQEERTPPALKVKSVRG